MNTERDFSEELLAKIAAGLGGKRISVILTVVLQDFDVD